MGKKILLADDSITIQKVIELTFSDEDFEVVTVGNGRLAIEKAQEVRPDIVLCDIIMPEKDGYEVCEFVKGQLPGTPVLLLTGAFEPFDQERAARVGADGFLAKPFEPQSLIAKVKDLLAKAPPAAAVAPPRAAVAPAAEAEAEVVEESFEDADAEMPAVVAALDDAEPLVQLPDPEAEPEFAADSDEDAGAAPGTFADAFEQDLDADTTPTEEAAVIDEVEDWSPAPAEPDQPVASEAAADFDEGLPAGDELPPAEEAPAEEPGAPALDEDFFTAEPAVAGPELADDLAGLTEEEAAALSAPEPETAAPLAATFEEADAGFAPVESPLDDVADAFEEPAPSAAIPSTQELSLEERASASARARSAAPVFDEVGDFGAPAAGDAELPPEPDFEALDSPEPAAAAEPEESFAGVDTGAPPEPVTSEAAQVSVPADMVAQIAQRVVAQISDKVVREVAWEVIPELAEALIKKEIQRLRAELDEP